MQPTTMDLVKNSQTIDQQLQKIGELDRPVSALADTGSTRPIYGDGGRSAKRASTPADQSEANKNLSDALVTAEHPFGNNDNNRLVAERVARDEKRANAGKPVQLAKPLTAGEASQRDIDAADEFEKANPEVLDDNSIVEQHVSEAQRQTILAERAEQVIALAPGKGAPAPPPLPASFATGQEGQGPISNSGFAPPVKA